MQLSEETVGKKVIYQSKVYKCIGFAREPSAEFESEDGARIGCCAGSPVAKELKPFEEEK